MSCHKDADVMPTQRLKYPEGIPELGNFEPPKIALAQSKQKVSSTFFPPKEYFQSHFNATKIWPLVKRQ